MTSATQDLKPVLFVLTSHSVKGETGESTGFYLGEVTHPLAVLDAAGIPVEFASIAGGEPSVDGLDLNDAVNARYWNSEGFRHAIRNTSRLSDVDQRLLRHFLRRWPWRYVGFPDKPGRQQRRPRYL